MVHDLTPQFKQSALSFQSCLQNDFSSSQRDWGLIDVKKFKDSSKSAFAEQASQHEWAEY